MPLYRDSTCKSSSSLIDSNIFRNLVPSKLNGYIIQLSHSLNWKPTGAIDSFKSWKVLIISRFWKEGNSSEKTASSLLLVTTIVYLNNFGDKKWVQDSSTIVVYIFYLAVNISSKSNSHSTDCCVAIQSLLLIKQIHCFFDSAFFRGKWNFAICFFSLLA